MSAIEAVGLVPDALVPQPIAAPVAPKEAQAHPMPSDSFIPKAGGGFVESHISVDPTTHQTVVRVVDAATQEVIRELPPEAILQLSASLAAFIGRRMDTKA